MSRELTTTVSEEVYRCLHSAAGNRTISQIIEDLARPVVSRADLDNSYLQMAQESARESEALEWSEGLIQDASR